MSDTATLPATPPPAPAAPQPAPGHTRLAIALHWGSAATLLLAVVAVLLHSVWDDEPLHGALLAVHRQAALAVLLLLVLRMAARLASGLRATPVPGTAMPACLRLAGAASHGALYLGLLVVPLLGSALSDARGQHQRWLGLLPLPRLAAPDPDLADTLADVHAWAAWALGGLVVLHVVAALWHHMVRRDGVLRAMWPGVPTFPRQPGSGEP